ncbi:multidrug ABC transporter permease [Peribacillus cavernae]|uniref:Multidrug ABC transporter permease n=1 Tax=Peribacillus cavernae TaxID=1674310 RepID=A0A3S0TXH4_9BACI|nr:DUF6449 domain-containing protein [Peribacillus cavernae]MDQ0219582.1 ABC-2 type transport system permease protein [Peribacillus cavernae]RUQ25873.1 multidrug ABC transporter permease [Peribacillus cavernae]
MPSKMSLFNKEAILRIVRSVGWIPIFYFFGLLFALPIRILMTYSNENTRKYMKVASLFQYDFGIQLVFLIIVPVLLAIFLFRFLHLKQAADLMHSLPLKRETIYHQYSVTGMALLVLPIILIAIVILFIHIGLDLEAYFEISDIFYWAGITILFNLLLFTASVFVGMMTGISVVQGVLSYIFLLFPVGIVSLLFLNLKTLLYGFPADYYLNRELDKMSPLTYAAVLENKPFQSIQIILYLVLIIVLYALSLFFYQRRKVETASEAIAFSNLRAIFKYGVTFCTMLLGGAYFSLVQAPFGWVIFGYAIGAVIGYIAAEMVLRKTWRVFGRIKGLAVYVAVMVVLITGTQALSRYEDHLPEQSDIKSVFLTDDPSLYLNKDEAYYHNFVASPLKEEKNIEAVLKLHRQIIEKQSISDKQNLYFETSYFVYKLKNGKKVIREYAINKEQHKDLYRPIFESREFKLSTNEIFKLNENEADRITMTPNGPFNRQAMITEPVDLKEAVSILKEEVLNETYNDSVYYRDNFSNTEIFGDKDKSVHLEIKPSYKKFNHWLKKKNMLAQAKVTADDISYVLVARNNSSEFEDNPGSAIEWFKEHEKDRGIIKVTDKDKIELCLDQASQVSQNGYIAAFYYKGQIDQEIKWFDEEHVPDFIKDHDQ